MEFNKENIENFIKAYPKVFYTIILFVIITILVLIVCINLYSEDEDFEIEENEDIYIEPEEKVELIKVYITGEVKHQGVIELEEGSRIEDAINIAGGITEEANLDNVNLAYIIEDGQKIYIPNKSETESEIISTENGGNVIFESYGKASSGKININTANIQTLCEIPGVGEALAQRIIDYREQNGKFKTIEDLKNVSGIGDKKLESIVNYVIVK